MGKRIPPQIHSKRPDHHGRTKDRKHGTRSWTTWVSLTRISKPRFFRRTEDI